MGLFKVLGFTTTAKCLKWTNFAQVKSSLYTGCIFVHVESILGTIPVKTVQQLVTNSPNKLLNHMKFTNLCITLFSKWSAHWFRPVLLVILGHDNFVKWSWELLRSAVGKTHVCGRHLWWTIPFHIFDWLFWDTLRIPTDQVALARPSSSYLPVYMSCALAFVLQVRSLYVPWHTVHY